METQQWHRTINNQTFLISTSRDLLPHTFVQSVFDNPAVYWAKPLSDASTKAMLENSCTLGLYKLDNDTPTPIGMARIITDTVTLAFLTDVFVSDEYRRFGLGKWLIQCCREVVQVMPDLRWMLLFTADEHLARMYEQQLGMRELGREGTGLFPMGARRAQIQEAAAATMGKQSDDSTNSAQT
jgi:GNAT superfamily N-acetyltransferase